MSAKFRASERELQHMRRELTNAKKKKRFNVDKRTEFSKERTVEEMTDENERIRIELEDAIEKVKELQLQRNDFLEQRKISKQRLDKLQRHNEDLLKKNEFNQKWKKAHNSILDAMQRFAKMQGGITYAMDETPGISDKATKLYLARNNMLRVRNAKLEESLNLRKL